MIQEFVQQIEETIREATYDIHTALPGTISAFDPTSGMATVKPEGTMAMKNGKKLKYPSIVKVPVIFPQGKEATIAYPIKQGDGCIIIVCENDLKPWMSHGQETASDMKFDLSNAVCIPGLYSEGNEAVQKAVDEDAIVIKNKDMEVTIKNDELLIEYAQNSIILNKDNVKLQCGQCNVMVKSDAVEIEGNLLGHGVIEGVI